MEKKSLTKGDLERRIKNAVVLVPKDKDTISIYFDGKGLRLDVTQDYAVISTGFHRHVFNSYTAQGVSRPWLYVKRFIEIALANDCTVKDAKGETTRSYGKLMAILKEKEDKTEYNVCWYIDLWFNNIFHPLYGIGETEAESFLVYESYLHNIARNHIILSEKVNGMTNLEFINAVVDDVKKFTEGIDERVIFQAKSDEQKMQENIDALQEHETDKAIEEGAQENEQ